MESRQYIKVSKDQIEKVALEYGSRLKTTVELAAELGISRAQVYYIVNKLRKGGMLIKKKQRDYEDIVSNLKEKYPNIESTHD